MTAPTTEPTVASLPLTDRSGAPVRLTVGTDIVEVVEPARTFGQDDLADPDGHGRFQRRVVALPDVRDGVVTPMLLTIASNDDLYLVRRKPGEGADWAAIDLGAAFGAGANIRALGAAATADDRIAVAVAVDEGQLTRLFVAYDLTSAGTDWSHVPWIDCGTRPGVRVQGIRVLDGGDRTWTVVCTGSTGPNDSVFLLRSADDRRRRFADALVFSPGATFQEILDFEAGVHPTFGAGLYVLGASGKTRVLQFRPFPDYDRSGRARTVPPIVDLPSPAGANVVEAGPTGRDGTDLYVGGDGVVLITAVEQDEQEDAVPVTVAAADGLTNVVDVALSPAPDGDPVVWALRANGDLNVVTPRPEGGWGNRLLLRTGIEEIAPVARDEHQSASLIAVRGTGAAVQLWRDAGTGAWNESFIPVDDPNEVAVTPCFGTTVRLLDDAGIPRTDIRVTVSASALTSVSLNGATTYLGPGLTVDTTPDANGAITLYDRVESLTPASYRFAVDVLPHAVDVNPAAGVHERFRRVTADDLRKAQVTAADGTRTPLLDDEGRAGPVDAVVRAMNQGATVAASSDGALPGIRVVDGGSFSSTVRADALPDGYVWGVRTSGGMVQTMGSAEVAAMPRAATTAAPRGFGETIADFFEGLVAGVKNAASFVLRKIGDAVEFVCEIAGAVKRWVLETLEEIGAFFTWLWDKIKVTLSKVWDWLKFVFDWKDMLRVRDALVESTKRQLTRIEGEIRESKSTVNAGFDLITTQLDTWRAQAGVPPRRLPPPQPGSSAKDTVRGAQSADDRKAAEKAGGSPVASWVFSQMASLADQIVAFDGPSPFDRLTNGAIDFVDGLAGDQLANLQRCIDTIKADLSALFGNKVPSLDDLSFDRLRTALVSVGVEAARALIDGLRALVLRLVDLSADVIAAVQDGLFRKVRFPFIEKLVAFVSPGTTVDTSFRLIDGMMLLIAVPTTIAYKVLAGRDALPSGDLLDEQAGQVGVLAEGTIERVARVATGLKEPFSQTMHVAVPFCLFGVSIYSYVQAMRAESRQPSPTSLKTQWIVLAFSAVALTAEYRGVRHHRGDKVATLEQLGALISTVRFVKGALFVTVQTARKEPDGQAIKMNAAIDFVCNAAHLLVRTVVFSAVREANDKKRAAADQAKRKQLDDDDWLQLLLWCEQIFGHVSSMFSDTAKIVSTPETKVVCLMGSSGTRLITTGIAFGAVCYARGTNQRISG